MQNCLRNELGTYAQRTFEARPIWRRQRSCSLPVPAANFIGMTVAGTQLNSLRLSGLENRRLALALALSLAAHLLTWGGYEAGKDVGWWQVWHWPTWAPSFDPKNGNGSSAGCELRAAAGICDGGATVNRSAEKREVLFRQKFARGEPGRGSGRRQTEIKRETSRRAEDGGRPAPGFQQTSTGASHAAGEQPTAGTADATGNERGAISTWAGRRTCNRRNSRSRAPAHAR